MSASWLKRILAIEMQVINYVDVLVGFFLDFNVLHLLKYYFVATSVKEGIYYNFVFLKSTEAGTASCYPLIKIPFSGGCE